MVVFSFLKTKTKIGNCPLFFYSDCLRIDSGERALV
jgi:hypothetical protein